MKVDMLKMRSIPTANGQMDIWMIWMGVIRNGIWEVGVGCQGCILLFSQAARRGEVTDDISVSVQDPQPDAL